LDLQVPLSVIDTAVMMRDISTYKQERIQASQKLKGASLSSNFDKDKMIDLLEDSLLFAMIISYAQGMALLQKASGEYQFDLSLQDVARIWRGGCIIRATILEDIRKAFEKKTDLTNLLLDDNIASLLNPLQQSIRGVIQLAVQSGIPAAALMASLSYYDAYRSEKLPLNLIQAQRDYFGAHTYERLDEKGIFHTHWI
jgi:6-phosphogluconate dehydrogenase